MSEVLQLLANVHFAWPWAALALPLPLAVAFLLPPAARLGGDALRVPFFRHAVHWPGRVRGRPRPGLSPALLAWLLLVGAAMRPVAPGSPLPTPFSGRDLMLAVDLSGSMGTTDMRTAGGWTSRLAAVKRIAGAFIATRHGDRVGLIVFGTRAYLQAPLTFDRRTVREMLEESEIGLAGKQTALGDAIGLAIKRLRRWPLDDRVLILLTDGRNTAGVMPPLTAARLAAALGVRVYTIGVGAPANRASASGDQLDESTLEAIARMTGGRYFRADDAEGLRRVYRAIDRIEPTSDAERVVRPSRELYMWPLGVAFVLVMLRLALGARRDRRAFARAELPGAAR